MGSNKNRNMEAAAGTGKTPEQTAQANTAANSGSEPSGDELTELSALLAEREDLLKRVQAEFENTLKRTAREIERAERAAESRIVAQILPLIDTVEAGVKTEPEGSEAHRTLLMVKGALDKTLTNLSVRTIDAKGARFDPELHEALMIKDGDDGAVLDVIQTGYRREGHILRHAKVIVGRKDHEPRNQETA